MATTNDPFHIGESERQHRDKSARHRGTHPAGQSTNHGLATPPSSQAHEERNAANMLMSPPPEELLRGPRARSITATPGRESVERFTGQVISNTLVSSKRKRTIASNATTPSLRPSELPEEPVAAVGVPGTPIEATPNPKPRKQTKRSISLARSPAQATTPTKASRKRASASPTKQLLLPSPHVHNPEADYIPPVPSSSREHTSSRRRSATPIPHYEPPVERFTPPREVFYTPTPSTHSPKSARPKSAAKSHGKYKKLVLQVKKECPDIDLNAPLPPPSPTDDPLLLSGPIPKPRPRPRRSHKVTHARDTPPMASTSPIHETDMDDTQLLDLNFNPAMDMTSDDTAIVPAFNFAAMDNANDGWSDDHDSDDNDFDHSGQFTGKFKMMTVPIKADPPSSCTRQRMDTWGRPISPFPKATREEPIPEDDEDEEMEESNGTMDVFGGFDIPLASTSGYRHTPSPPPVQQSELPDNAAEPQTNSSANDVEQPDFHHLDDQDSDSGAEEVFEDQVVPIHDDSLEEEVQPFAHEEPPVAEDAPEPEGSSWSEEHHVHFDESVSIVEVSRDPSEEATEEEVVPPPVIEESHRSPSPVLAEQVPSTPSASQGAAADSNYSPAAREKSPITPLDVHPAAVEPSPSLSPEPVVHEHEPPVAGPSSSIDESVAPSNEDPRSALDQTFELEVSDGEEEDEVSVVRELSQPPDLDSKEEEEEEHDDGLASSFARVSLMSSPNPFQTPGNGERVGGPYSPGMNEKAPAWEWEHDEIPAQTSVEDEFDDEGLESEDFDPKVIQITSDDPMAAARAAAILRLHKYNCIEQRSLKKRRHSQVGLDSALRQARRKNLSESGVSKSTSKHRRRTLGGVIGDKVYIPGSPLMTVSQLLKEAEASLHLEDRALSQSPLTTPLSKRNTFKTPAPRRSLYSEMFTAKLVPFMNSGPREWVKGDWKKLDTCYTDERLAMGEQTGLGVDTMAPADDVDLENVVDRFIELMGGESIVSGLGPAWGRDDVLKRARALQRKQRSGNVAPPTPSRRSSIVSTDTSSYHHYMSPAPPSVTSSETTACHRDGDVSAAGPSQEHVNSLDGDVMYTKLMDDAITTNDEENGERLLVTSFLNPRTLQVGAKLNANGRYAATMPRVPQTLANRMKGFIFSYLPKTASKPSSSSNAPKEQRGLPIPPPEIFKKPRLPISTPVPKPAPKPTHPKELVQLTHAPSKPSMIPRSTKLNPRRLVELNPVTPPERKDKQTGIPQRERRDSGASVQDLVKSFEDMERRQSLERQSLSRLEMRRAKSIQEWNAARTAPQKPVWRP